MLRFKLFGIHIEVHLSHLLIAGILGHLVAQWGLPQAGVPPEAPTASGRELWVATALWAFAISIAALAHELGHALMALHFGYRPTVHLVGLGGLTRAHPNETVPWQREATITVAGAMLGFTVAAVAFLAAYLLRQSLGEAAAPTHFFRAVALACGAWAVLNLMPVPPLDGGKLVSVLLVRAIGRRGFAVAQFVALFFGVVVLAFSAAKGEWILLIFFGLYVARVLVLLRGYFIGELPRHEVHPFDVAFAAATAHYQAGRYGAARQDAEVLLEADIQPTLRSRLHALLGWVSLKENQGRPALDHFAQVHGGEIPPHALAAAFSLVGDDTRALPLWEKAVERHDDSTLRHEWAGTLLRLGREREAKGVPQVQLSLAYVCAERVYEARGDFAHAGQMLEARCFIEPLADTAYDAACHFARAGDEAKTFELLDRALALGFHRGDLAASEPALSAWRAHQRFVSWLSRVKQSPPT